MPIRRTIITLLVFLALGAVVNVAVAWWLAWIPNEAAGLLSLDSNQRYSSFLVISPDRNLNGSHVIDIFPGEIGVSYSPGLSGTHLIPLIDHNYYRQVLPPWSRFRDPATITDEFRQHEVFGSYSYWEYASGWPMYALRSCYISCHDLEESRNVSSEFLGAPLQFGLEPNKRLPVRPIWPGFLINTLLYSAALWMVCIGPFAVRRAIRRRRGRCAHCGYPAGASPVCTECGRAVRSISVPSTTN